MQANIVIVGATRGFETLTYSIPQALDGRVLPGHRVLAPLRSRKVTGVVTEVGEQLSTAQLKDLLEVLEPRPLFDRAHLQLMEFLATYYMVSIADAYRSVIPAVARVESRTAYNLGTPPDALARATFTPVERTVIEKITKGAATARQLEKSRPAERGARHDCALRRRRYPRAPRCYHGAPSRNRGSGRATQSMAQASRLFAARSNARRWARSRTPAATGVRVDDLKKKIEGAERGAEESCESRIDRDRGGADRHLMAERRRSSTSPTNSKSRSMRSHRRSSIGATKRFYCGASRPAARPKSILTSPRERSRPVATF